MNPEEAKDIKQDFNGNCGYIYCLSFPNEKKYIGQTIKQWKQRWKRHKSSHSCCKALHSAIEKYGYESIDFQILEYCKTKEELNDRESYYIAEFNTIAPNGYNLKTKDTRVVYSLETRKKMSMSHRKRYADNINNNNKSVKERKRINNRERKRKEKNMLFYYYDEGINVFPILSQIKCLSLHLKLEKYLNSINQRQNWKNDEYRKKYIDNFKKIIRQKNVKKVYFVEMNQVFSCAGEIVEKFPEYKFNKSKICSCCLNLQENHKGFHFRYLENNK